MDSSSKSINEIKREVFESRGYFQLQWDTFWSKNFANNSYNSVLFETIMDCEEWNLINNTFLFLFSYFFFVQEKSYLEKYFDGLKVISKNYEEGFKNFLLDMNFANVCKGEDSKFIKSFIFKKV